MKHFLIQYRREHGTPEAWHEEVKRFTTALDNDAELADRIAYRCMAGGASQAYVNIATVMDDQANKILQSREYFQHYTAEVKRVSGGKVEVSPFSTVAETKRQA